MNINHLKHAASDLFQSTWGFLFVLEFARAIYNEARLTQSMLLNWIPRTWRTAGRHRLCAHALGCARVRKLARNGTWVRKLAREGASNRLCLPKDVEFCTVLYFYNRVDLSYICHFLSSLPCPKPQLVWEISHFKVKDVMMRWADFLDFEVFTFHL